MLLISNVFITSIYAKTSEELAEEIDQKEQELNNLTKELEDAEKLLEDASAKKTSSTNELDKIKLEMKELEAQEIVNELVQKQIEDNIYIKSLGKQEKEQKQNTEISSAYVSWKINPNFTTKLFVGSAENGVVKTSMYHQIITEDTIGEILALAKELDSLNDENDEYLKKLDEIEILTKSLVTRQAFLQTQIQKSEEALKRAENNTDGIRSKLGDVRQEIDQLTTEQNDILNKENDQTGGDGPDIPIPTPTPTSILPTPTGGGDPPPSGTSFYFNGTGRDRYQGHGVGLSQFGAYGAANHGWSAKKIVEFYYINTLVEVRTGHTVTPLGYSQMSADNYVAGLGEIPSKACGTLQKIEDWNAYADEQGWEAGDPKRNKYVIDNTSTVWDCWPEEAIKAQVIAARSYAVTSNQPICTTAACQVYAGGQAKAWASWETSNQYIVSKGSTHNNQIIRALYSSDNNQGYGTANNDTIFSNFSGNGTAYSYLRAANDNSVAYSYAYTHWEWNTYTYEMSDINEFLDYAANNYNTGGANSFIRSFKNNIGVAQQIDFIRDGSNRVRKIKITGNSGNDEMAGWLFKAIWNDWTYNTKPSNKRDYLYSLTIWKKDL